MDNGVRDIIENDGNNPSGINRTSNVERKWDDSIHIQKTESVIRKNVNWWIRFLNIIQNMIVICIFNSIKVFYIHLFYISFITS